MSKLDKLKTLSASAAYIAIIVFAVTNINPGGPNVTVENETVNVTTERPTYNLSCPTPNVSAPNVTVKDYPDNIQNADYDTRTSYSSGTYSIKNIDAYGELYGSSMSPSIMDGDIVLSEEFEGQDLQEGMIIRFTTDDSGPIIHRIVGDYSPQGYVYTSGDRTDSREKVELENITHIVKAVIYN